MKVRLREGGRFSPDLDKRLRGQTREDKHIVLTEVFQVYPADSKVQSYLVFHEADINQYVHNVTISDDVSVW